MGYKLNKFFLVSILIINIIYMELHFANAKKRYSPRQSENDEQLWREFEEFKEFKDFKEWKKFKKLNNNYKQDKNNYYTDESRRESIDYDGSSLKDINNSPGDVPPDDHPALVGRYVVNQSNWTSVATISRQQGINSFPFVNVVALSDGPRGNGSGVPYMFLTPLDFTSKDLKEDPRATLMVTLAQGSYCTQKDMEPIDPRCARTILSGKVKKIDPKSSEFAVAQNAIYERHPSLRYMPTDHDFYFAKLKIFFIAVLDMFGGAKFVSVKDYFNPPPLSPGRNNHQSYDYQVPSVNQF
ncbi:protein CREG1 [Microplitis demolitor]|uniref:protein CREG1 n=1 Tax=Microplitis demolitor TaxID=69319 RepID=UPI0004CCC72C|nr:protein CREG1 [Microplitis demolitor]